MQDINNWIRNTLESLWLPTLVVITLAALFLVVPAVFRRLRRGDATMADRVAAMVVLTGLVGAGTLLFTPMSDGPYRCSPVAYGSEGRKTVLPDGSEEVPPSPRTLVEPWLAAHHWREGICDDAARARQMTALAVVSASGLLAAGVVYIFGPSPARWTRRRSGPPAMTESLSS